MNKKSTDAYAGYGTYRMGGSNLENHALQLPFTIHRTKQHACNGLCAIMVGIEETFNVNSSLIEYSSKYLRSTNN